MKRFMLNTFLLTLAVALWGCGGSDNDDTLPAPAVSITVSQTSISSPASGGTYTVNVTTTGKEWGAYADKDFIKLDMKNSAAQSGTLTVTVPANPNTSARTGTVTVMSGSARQTISVSQEAAAQSAYNAPEGYRLVWQDEFDKGSELNASDWTHDFGDGRGAILAYGDWFLRLKTGHKGIGIHGSTGNENTVPGRDSEGCIRMRDPDIVTLKEQYARVGMPVIIKQEEQGLKSFEIKR